MGRLNLFFVFLIIFAGACSSTKSTQTTNVECTTQTPDRWSTSVQSIVSTNCASCHTHQSYSNYSSVAADASAIASAVSSGRMPQGTSLSAADKEALVQWAVCGAPQ